MSAQERPKPTPGTKGGAAADGGPGSQESASGRPWDAVDSGPGTATDGPVGPSKPIRMSLVSVSSRSTPSAEAIPW